MKRAFSIPILFFVSFLLSMYFVLPKYSQFKGLKYEISEKELSLQQSEKYFLNLQKASTDLEDYRESLEKIDLALPREVSVPSLMNFFQLKSSESGLILTSMGITGSSSQRLEKVEGQTDIQETYFSLHLAGSIPSFENFLRNIERSSRLVEVETISLGGGAREETKETKETKEGLREFSLLVKVYSY